MSGIYLAWNSSQLVDQRTNLLNTLIKSGQQVYPSDTIYDQQKNNITENIGSAGASVHILGLNYGDIQTDNKSMEEIQYNEAVRKIQSDPNFKLFIWFPFNLNEIKDDRQLEFVTGIRNSITNGVIFSNVISPIQLADDIRISNVQAQKQEFQINDTDIFLIHNQLDDNEALDVMDMLSDIVPVEKLNIIQDSDMDYSEFCAQQIGKSKLAVVYFKESAEWALPFTQQIWKKIGGASSHTPILLIGDEDPDTNFNKRFKAPKVVSLIVSGELIPLEIKVQYDKAVEGSL